MPNRGVPRPTEADLDRMAAEVVGHHSTPSTPAPDPEDLRHENAKLRTVLRFFARQTHAAGMALMARAVLSDEQPDSEECPECTTWRLHERLTGDHACPTCGWRPPPDPVSPEQEERWTINVCIGCGALMRETDNGALDCGTPGHGLQAKTVEVMPVSDHQASQGRVIGIAEAEVQFRLEQWQASKSSYDEGRFDEAESLLALIRSEIEGRDG